VKDGLKKVWGGCPYRHTANRSRALGTRLVRTLLLALLVPVLCAPFTQAADAPGGATAPPKAVNVFIGARGPRIVPWTSSLTLLDVFRQATKHEIYIGASPKKVRLTRGADRTLIELRPIALGEVPDPRLRPGDTIEIPD
jgi:hypothetical protein